MSRQEAHFDAMLRHLGATYYQTLHGEATPTDVVRALRSVEQEATRRTGRAEQAPQQRHGHRTGRWRVRDVMTFDVITVDRRTPAAQIARLMSEHHINAVPVVTGGRRVAGVVSEADLLRTQRRPAPRSRLLRRQPSPATSGTYTAAQLMTTPAITIHPDAPIGAAARRMTDHHLTLLPVVDGGGELLGIVSRRDLLMVFLRSDDEIEGEVRQVLTDVLLLAPGDVTVSAHDGLVTLSGHLEREGLAPLAVRLAADVDGVLGVTDHLSAAPAESA